MKKFLLLMLSVIFLLCFIAWPAQAKQKIADWTVIGYFNGDNNLARNILTIIDFKLERIGSSDNVNVLILYDGAPETKYYGQDFSGTKLLYLEKDNELKKINSKVLSGFKGEFDMGSPETVEKLVRYATSSWPAKHYMFLTFTHGDGIIEGIINGFSPDITSGSTLSIENFHTALKRGLGGKKLTALIMFSCLMNMIEINYALKDTTEIFIGSPDMIEFTAYPFEGLARTSPGGIAFDKMIEKLKDYPGITNEELIRFVIDASIELYKEPIASFSESRFMPLSLAGIDTKKVNEFVSYFKKFSKVLENRLRNPVTQTEIFNILLKVAEKNRYYLGAYCDLYKLLAEISNNSFDSEIKSLADKLILILEDLTICRRHEYREFDDSRGIGIYFPHPSIVNEIYQSYQKIYRESQFAKDTGWDEVIELFRKLVKNKDL